MGSIKHTRSEHNGNLDDTGDNLGQSNECNTCTTISSNSMFRNGTPSRDMLVRRNPNECVEGAFLDWNKWESRWGEKSPQFALVKKMNEVHEC